MADAKVQVEGVWIDHIKDKAAATLRDLRNEFSLTSLAEKALGNLTSLSITTVMSAAAAEMEKLSKVQIEMERNSTRLGTALKMSGQYTNDNVKALKDLANLTESKSGFLFDDQEILRAETYAMTIGGISVKEMPQLIEAASNLAAVLNSDLQTGMEAIVRGGMGMERQLKAVGIEITSTGDRAKDTQAIIDQVMMKWKDAAENALGPVEKRYRELEDAIDDNDKKLAGSIPNIKIWGAEFRKVLSDVAVAWKNYHESANPSGDSAGYSAYEISMKAANGKSAGVQGPWGLSGTPGWAQGGAATMGTSAAFVGPAGPPGGSASAQSTFVSESDERARKLREEISLYGKLGLAKRDAALADASFSDLSRLASDAGALGGNMNLGPPGRSAYAKNINERDYFQTRAEADKEKKAFDEAHARAASVASTLVSGLRMVEQQGKITFESIAKVMERMLVDLGMQQLERGLTSALTNIFGGGGGGQDTEFDSVMGRKR